MEVNYNTDKDFQKLLKSFAPADILLDYFHKKKSVNIAELKKQFYHRNNATLVGIDNFIAKGLLKQDKENENLYHITGRAKWQRFYTHRSWGFWGVLISIIALLVAILALRATA